MKQVCTIRPEKRKSPFIKYYNVRFVETHRIYNKWYLELWFWLQEHEGLVYAVLGVITGFLFVIAFIYFNKGNQW